MTEINKKELRSLAEAQPEKTWKRDDGRESCKRSPELMFDVEGPECVSDYEDWGYTQSAADYITAVCPAAVLALLDEIRTLEIRPREVAKACATAEQERDLLRAEIENLHDMLEQQRQRVISLTRERDHLREVGRG